MSIVDNLERIKQWVEEEICSKVKLKTPDDDRVDASYQYQLVNPSAFVLYIPSKDRAPPLVPAPIPSLCIQLIEGKDFPGQGKGAMKMRLCFATWNPGTHAENFMRSSDGWKDAWNFVDAALRELENSEYMAGFRIIKEEGIVYGPVTEQDAVPDFYPYWFAWVSFSLEHGITRNPKEYQQYL